MAAVRSIGEKSRAELEKKGDEGSGSMEAREIEKLESCCVNDADKLEVLQN